MTLANSAVQAGILGYPRIGANRELKFISEAYFRNELSQEEFSQKAAAIRKNNLAFLKDADLNVIPALDFSLYDSILDLILALGFIPERFRKLNLEGLELYFAMARGYQKDGRNAVALSLKKWFGTNYHYLVPEFDDGVTPEVNAGFLTEALKEASEAGIAVRPVLPGPFTFAKLTRITGTRDAAELEENVSAIYRELLLTLNREAGITAFTVLEPSLSMDLSAADIAMFRRMHTSLLQDLPLKVYLGTSYGDIRDVMKDIPDMGYAGLWLDLSGNNRNRDLLREVSFKPGFELGLGVVSGQNIWKNHYDESLEIVREIQKNHPEAGIVITASASLLHVPVSLQNEKTLPPEKLKHLAFAAEKTAELRELRDILNGNAAPEISERNRDLFRAPRFAADAELQSRVAGLRESDFERKPARKERLALQDQVFKFPPLPATTIGSFPQTAEVRALRKKFRLGEITRESYDAEIRKLIAACIKEQENTGLDVLVHGEFERNDMVEFFGRKLEGYIFTDNGWVQSYGTRCVKPPVIWGSIRRTAPLTTDISSYAASLSEKPVKGMLTGPITILNWSFPAADIPAASSVMELALAIRDEVLDLEKAGVRIIQIDEAALREKLPLRHEDQEAYLTLAVNAFRLTSSGVKPETQIHTHMCYSEFGEILKSIDAMDADVISFEASRSNLTLLRELRDAGFETRVGPGVYDIHSPRIPSVAEFKSTIKRILEILPREQVWINPDCGLKTRGNAEVWPCLNNMMAAVREIRAELEEKNA